MTPPQAVFFDLFGTLVDEASERDALDDVFVLVRDRFHIEEPAADVAGDFVVALMDRVAEEKALPRDAPIGPYAEAARDAFDTVLGERDIVTTDADREWFWRTLLGGMREGVRLFPDAGATVATLARTVRHVGLVTDADGALATLVLAGSGLGRHVAAVTTAEEAGAFKPDPAPYLLALAKAQVAPEDAVMVGDSYERDVVPARALGLHAVLVDRFGARTVDGPRVRSLAELPALITKLG